MEFLLVIKYEFMLYKIIPLPLHFHNSSYVLIVPSSDCIAIDKSKMFHLELSEVQSSNCKPITNMLICPFDYHTIFLFKIFLDFFDSNKLHTMENHVY